MMEEVFFRTVEHVFNNWTALRLAVEHSMGGPNSKQTANDCLKYVVQYCTSTPNIQIEEIQDLLEDILDEEFDTICEDGSPKEVAEVLFSFLQILKTGNLQHYQQEFEKLPVCNQEWINMQKPQCVQSVPVQDFSSDDEADKMQSTSQPMDEDSEWTEVKSRRKR